MRSTRTSHAESGFSLVELLVATTIVAFALAVAGGLFVASRNFIQEQILRIETTQALRGTLENLARDLRLGGACLPPIGDFVALSGSNSGTIDGVITRTGLVQPNLTCIRAALTANAAASDSLLNIDAIGGFADGMRAYIRNANGTGDYFDIVHVDTGNKTLQKAGGAMSQDYPIGSGVFALDERQYAIDTTKYPGLPVLTIAVNGAQPVEFAFGIESVDIQYQLARNCPPCDVVDLPADPGEWRLVTQLLINVTARSRTPGGNGQYYRRSGQISAKPRNLLPG
jgi:prepilin-type N-terminal cleavage/methylation domain-containing protein